MQTYSLPTLSSMLPGASAPAQRKHTFTLHTPTFASLPALRKNIKVRLQAWGIEQTYSGMLQLAVCEVITNLVKHPPLIPDIVHVTFSISEYSVVIDIADNGTPFATFEAQCNTARQCAAAAESLSEGGYGLPFIIKLTRALRYFHAGSSTDGLNHFLIEAPIHKGNQVITPHDELRKITDAPAPVRDKIFIVDTDPLTADFYNPLLSQHYNIFFFNHAADALARFSEEKPALVISNLAMPGMDGPTLRRHLSSLENGDTTPFIFLSNNASIAQERYVTQAGIDDYLCKPVSPERLMAVSARIIERASRFTAALQGRIDSQITLMLNPSLPATCQGWTISTRTAVAEAGGGDFTVYKSHSDFFVAALADVMGHGLQAKFFAYAYAGYLRSLIQLDSTIRSPADFLTHVSNAVNADRFLDSTIMTCLAFALNKDNTVALACAGHPPPWRIGQKTEPVDIAGPLPGLLGESGYSEKTLRLSAGERLVIATDGFWDSWDNPHTLATDLGMHRGLGLDDYTNALWRTAYERAQARHVHKDDATLIVIEAGDIP